MKKGSIIMIGLLIISVLATACSGSIQASTQASDSSKEASNEETKEETNEEGLAYYLVFSEWDKLEEEQKNFFAEIYDGDLEKGQNLYETYFLKFNLVHEISHTVQSVYGVENSRYADEQGVNDIAVAYWNEVEPSFVDELEILVDQVLSKLTSPLNEGEDEKEYFNDNYGDIVSNPNIYGYFQFKFVKNALEREESLIQALEREITNEPSPAIGERPEPTIYEVGDVVTIANGYIQTIHSLGYYCASIQLVNQATPSIQFVTPIPNDN